MADFGPVGAWLLLTGVLVGALVIAVVTVWLGNRVLAADTGPEHNAALSPYVTVVGLVYGALLGFTVVVGWQAFLSAEVNVADEAATLTTMYRQTVAMPQPEQSQIREQLREYAEAAQDPRWGKHDFEHTSPAARAALTEMYRIVGNPNSTAANSPISQQFLERLTELAADRSTRILDSRARIPSLLWASLIFGGLVLIALTAFLRLQNSRGHMVLTGAVAVLLALLLYLVFVLDHPFGPLGVTSQAFARAITVFDEVDSGT
ncbi:MAG: hypothetical protein AB7G47_14090 [Mycolicibacterium sp.]|uniref:bestrophin-like domain n=1 Tax=Mycolicibacterium sp. TaxID=2320850 RepID=UPI003D0AAA45